MAHFEFERKALDGLNLYFQGWQTQQDQKAVICLVHGLGEHSGRYVLWAEMLNLAGYSLISYDLRGHGKSGGNRGHISSTDDYLRDTDILLKEADERFRGVPCFIYGHSLGGLIVVNYVLRRKPKIAGVVITALSNNTALQKQTGKITIARSLGAILPNLSMSTGLVPSTISRDPDVVKEYIADTLVHSKATLRFATSTLDMIAWNDLHASEWTLPVLFMHGEKDQLGYVEGSREFASKINGDCTLKIWPGLFHEVHNEPEKEEVFQYLLTWLDGHLLTKY